MADNTLISKYLARPVVKQRNAVTLSNWSAYESATDIPPAPDDAWVRVRILAEQIPLALDSYVLQTIAFFMQDPTTTTNILQFISEDNDEPTEVALAAQNSAILSGFAQRFADTTIGQQQVDNWRDRQPVVPAAETTQPPAPAARKVN